MFDYIQDINASRSNQIGSLNGLAQLVGAQLTGQSLLEESQKRLITHELLCAHTAGPGTFPSQCECVISDPSMCHPHEKDQEKPCSPGEDKLFLMFGLGNSRFN